MLMIAGFIVSSTLFFYGIIVLSKKHNCKLLKVSAIIFIALYLVLFIGGQVSGGYLNGLQTQMQTEATTLGIDLNNFAAATEDQTLAFNQKMAELMLPVARVLLIFFGLMFVNSILFGIGLILAKNKIKLALTSGILQLIGTVFLLVYLLSQGVLLSGASTSATLGFGLLFSIVGILCLPISMIFQIIILYNESKK